MAPSGEKYVLLVRDDNSGYGWFYPSSSKSAGKAYNARLDWCASFGVPNSLMSDGPTHFRNETIPLVANILCTPHQFTLSYCPWSSGRGTTRKRIGPDISRDNHRITSLSGLMAHFLFM